MLNRRNFTFALAAAASAAPAGEWTELLPNEKFEGWTRVPIPPVLGVDPRLQWRVDAQKREIICTGTGGHEWLVCDREFGDFDLQVDWRFTPRAGEPRYNSGIGVRLSKFGEIWHQAQTGQSGAYLFGADMVNGALQRTNLREQMKENRVKPVGEWNHFDIRAQGALISLGVNGEVVNEWNNVGLRRGLVGLEAEGFEVTFRNFKIRPLS